ncbi:uncharacterized protein LOC141512630 isoform X2 [Macrotis lagotis]|uniref:uncharacterized protein LOC141512630 isoform X2 n=1 Tax=Macrotis lagotis TaxID=92651 RepID=UPI003D681096
MASDIQMPAPVCLIENSRGQLRVKQEAREILSSITNPVVVVAVVGLYHPGRSYLMNNLLGEKSGFSLGSMVQSHTKGIWMCCVPHPKKPNHTLILLDIEGLGNMEEDDNKNDSWLFVLAVLLSSTFVYNSMSTINQQAMEQLQFVIEQAESIQSKSALNPDKVENISEFPNIFPNFRGIMQYLISKLKFNTSGKPVKMPAPLCLIENSKGQLKVNQKALEILSSITNPVVVVAIVGLYRTGKSYLMNKLAGKKSGFSLGSTVQSHTKGIWMWCVPHPKKPNHTLVLLDTEGLGDVEKGDNSNDSWIFALAVLLSSTFVYNSMGTINQQAIDQLYYVTKLTDHIRSKSAPKTDMEENSSESVSFFPDFVWTVRDFTLELEMNGKPITSDEYLETALKLKQGKPEEVKIFNDPRESICQLFPKRKCFVFSQPAQRKKLSQLEKLHDSELDPEFVEQAQHFCSYIFLHSNVKTLQGGITVNGPCLEYLVLSYVNAIHSGDMPRMEDAIWGVVQLKNSAAVQRALTHYEDMMKQRVQFPTETLTELLDIHATCEKEAIEIFHKDSFEDVDQEFQKLLMSQLEAKRLAFYKQNMIESEKRCRALIQDIFSPLEEAVNNGTFFKPGGYGLFLQMIKELKEKYHQQPRKGIQAEEVLQEYLKSKEDVVDAILQADQSLSAKEKDIEVEHLKVQAAEAAAKLLNEIQEIQEMMEQRGHLFLFYHTRMEIKRKLLLVEQKNAQALKLKGDNTDDTWISAWIVLLRSIFNYNSMGNINQEATDQLNFLTKLIDKLISRSAPNMDEVENSSEFVSFFPNFVWTVHGFTLELEVGGKSITSDVFLEMALKPKKGKPEKVKMFNQPRQCIRQLFPKRKCFIFNLPMHQKKLSQLENFHDGDLDPRFVEQVESFCSYIFHHSNVKTLQGGITVNGPRLEYLVLTYLEAITSGDMPCMENAILGLVQLENSAAVQRALILYEGMMKQRVQFPTETLKELLEIHATCEREAIGVFLRDSFKDVNQKFQKELTSQLEAKLDDFCNQNQTESVQRCRALLQDIFSPLEEAVKKGAFSKPGGYHLFLQKKKELKQKYYQQPRKGIQSEETLQDYLKSKKDEAEAILQADPSLSAKEKEIEVEHLKAQAAEVAVLQLEERQKKNLEMMEQKEKSYQEHVKQMTGMMELERKLWIAEQERVQALKLKEQRQLLKEEFKKEAEQLQEEINYLTSEMDKPKEEESCILL